MSAALTLALLTSALSADQIADDEIVVCYPTFASRDADGQTWTIRIHGLICEPEESSLRRNALLATLRSVVQIQETGEERARFDRRVRLFLADNERHKTLEIRLGSRRHLVGPSQPNGHFENRLRLSAREVESLSRDERGWVEYTLAMRAGDARRFAGRVQFIQPEGFSVISDIDDTIKESRVGDRRELLANTFLREFRAVEGMAPLYRKLAERGAAFHYVSASPWQLYEPLAEFLDSAQFPAGSFHMKIVRAKDATVFDLFGPQNEWKRGTIEPILEAFPRRRFVLIGDSGEQDPEIFGDFARRWPGRIAGIFIRRTGNGDDERFRTAFRALERSKWHVFDDPGEIEPALLRLADEAR